MNMQELRTESMNFVTAEKVPVYLGTHRTEDTEHKAVVDSQNNNKVFSFVSNGYKVVQHRELTESMINALSLLNIKADAKIVSAGERLIIDFNFSDSKISLKNVGEEFTSGIRLINSYDKTTGVFICPRIERLACSNGMILTKFIKGIYEIHTSQNLSKDLSLNIKSLIDELVQKQEAFSKLVNDSIVDSIEWKYCDELMQKLVEREKHRKALMDILSRLGKENITRWDIVNAVTSYVTHGEFISTSVNEWLNVKAEKILTTPLIELRR